MDISRNVLLLFCATIGFLRADFISTEELKKIPIDPNKEIVFGQSAFLSEGSLQLYSELIRNAILARFYEENEKGGIHGKKLRLVCMDDGGEPNITEQNTKAMLKKNISLFIGYSGTRGISKILPLIKSKRISVFFPWGGDEELRKPDLTHLVNGLGLMEPQIKALVDYAVNELKLTKIGIFHDDGSFGIKNKETAIQELARYKITPVAVTAYNRFTMDIATPTKQLLEADPKIIICLSTSSPAVKLINKFFEQAHYGTKFIGIDSTMFTGNILHQKGVHFAYASPMPNPQTSDLPIVQQFRAAIKKQFPNDPINILSLAYYIHASIIVEALKQLPANFTQEMLLQKIEAMQNYSVGGFMVNFNKQTRHAYTHTISIIEG